MSEPSRHGVPEHRASRWPHAGTERPVVIGIAGGSGSGKTTIAHAVLEDVGPDRAVLVPHDAYYRDLPHLEFEQRAQVNFDHPDSLETELMVEQIKSLVSGSPIELPVYDFSLHLRKPQTVATKPAPVILVEGILVLAEPALRDLMDLKIFIDTDADLRLARRLQRDVAERRRSVASVLDQYMTTVRPMHLQFVEPNKRYADIIIPEGYNTGAVGTVIRMIHQVVDGGK